MSSYEHHYEVDENQTGMLINLINISLLLNIKL